MDQNNTYKRTIAGSVGAGMGAILNASGRTYYILEHKTQSKYHNVGESQKIIIDEIEMGRDASCQVRWEDTTEFQMVSRKHAAIVRDGQNWKLINLSATNKTLVNGTPIPGTYYLQSGDEIQLSTNGPRMGFIVPQGKQGLTSSIRLTERMNLFRQQALRPYRTALWIMGIVMVLVILGFGGWNYKLSQDNKELKAQAEQLIQQGADLDKQIGQLEEQIQNNPENEELKQQMEELKQQKQQVQTRYTTIYRDNPALQQELQKLKEQVEEANDVIDIDDDEEAVTADETASKPATDGGSGDIADYYDDIYTLKVDKITIEWNGKSNIPTDIEPSKVIVGTAFVLPGGKLVTSRSNLEPWIYGTGSWCDKLAWAKSVEGCNIIIDYLAYSTRGTGHPLRFRNTDFNLAALHIHDKTELINVTKEVTKTWEMFGIEINKKEYKNKSYYRTVRTPESYCAGVLELGAPGGLPSDDSTAQSLKGGEEVTIAGFNGNPSIHNLTSSIKYHSSHTSRNAEFRLITLQNTYDNAGFTGSPVFFKESDGSYRVVGVNVGNFNGETYVARITDLKK